MEITIEIEARDGYVLCRPSGELDAHTVGEFRETLGSLGGTDVVVDLSAVPFMDSAGLNALIGGIRRIRETRGDVAVACSSRSLARLLHTVGLDRVVPITGSVEGARAELFDRGADRAGAG